MPVSPTSHCSSHVLPFLDHSSASIGCLAVHWNTLFIVSSNAFCLNCSFSTKLLGYLYYLSQGFLQVSLPMEPTVVVLLNWVTAPAPTLPLACSNVFFHRFYHYLTKSNISAFIMLIFHCLFHSLQKTPFTPANLYDYGSLFCSLSHPKCWDCVWHIVGI